MGFTLAQSAPYLIFMKLVTYHHNDKTQVGALIADHVVPVADNMIALLERGAAGMADVAATLTKDMLSVPLADVTLLPPVLRPGKVIALGRNYAAHAAEGGAKVPDFPMLFHKTHTSLTGANSVITIPAGTERVDFEAELAVVIGKTCKNVAEADALDYVAGYTVANDVTARDWQRRTSQFTAGKMVDGFGPLGPALVTPDEVGDVQNLNIQSWHNGVEMQSSNTKMMLFPVAFTIEYISKITTLEVGDVILTGTPEGVGFARTPPVFMQPGDEITIEVENVGRLTNTFA